MALTLAALIVTRSVPNDAASKRTKRGARSTDCEPQGRMPVRRFKRERGRGGEGHTSCGERNAARNQLTCLP